MDERGLFFERKIKRAYLIAVLRQAMEREKEKKRVLPLSLSLLLSSSSPGWARFHMLEGPCRAPRFPRAKGSG